MHHICTQSWTECKTKSMHGYTTSVMMYILYFSWNTLFIPFEFKIYNTWKSGPNGRFFADDILNVFPSMKKSLSLIWISLKYVLKLHLTFCQHWFRYCLATIHWQNIQTQATWNFKWQFNMKIIVYPHEFHIGFICSQSDQWQANIWEKYSYVIRIGCNWAACYINSFWRPLPGPSNQGKLESPPHPSQRHRNPSIDWTPGPRLNIKTVLSTYGDFHVKDKTAVRTSYL